MIRLLIIVPLLAVSCGPVRNQPVPQPTGMPPALTLSAEAFRPLTDTYKDYVANLLKLQSKEMTDRAEGLKRVDALNYSFFEDDRDLIAKALKGDSVAEAELGRRGEMLDAMFVYWGKVNQAKWNEARQRIVALGKDAQVVLITVLMRMLINGQFREIWPSIRYQLIELGDEAMATTQALLEAKEKETPDTVIFKEDDLIQLGDVFLGFGEKAKPAFQKFLASPRFNMRKAMVYSIGETRAGDYTATLIDLLSKDEAWLVRAAAADALCKVHTTAAKAGAPLMEALTKERDPVVRLHIVRSLGEVGTDDCVPLLIKTLETPNSDVVEETMRSLNRITLERIWSTDGWHTWYQTKYTAWRNRPKR